MLFQTLGKDVGALHDRPMACLALTLERGAGMSAEFLCHPGGNIGIIVAPEDETTFW